MKAIEVGEGVSSVWIVWKREYDGSGDPVFLAAYDGVYAEKSATALVDLLKRADAPGKIEATPVALWPLLSAEPNAPRHHSPNDSG